MLDLFGPLTSGKAVVRKALTVSRVAPVGWEKNKYYLVEVIPEPRRPRHANDNGND